MLSDFAKVEFYSVVLMLCDDCKVSNVNRTDRVDTVVCTSLPAMNRCFWKRTKLSLARRIREKYMIISRKIRNREKKPEERTRRM